jgi:hypothetical protein
MPRIARGVALLVRTAPVWPNTARTAAPSRPRLAQRGQRPCWLLNGGRLACSTGVVVMGTRLPRFGAGADVETERRRSRGHGAVASDTVAELARLSIGPSLLLLWSIPTL